MTLRHRLSLNAVNSTVRTHAAATRHIDSNLSEPPVILQQRSGEATMKYSYARAQQVLWLSIILRIAWFWQHSKG